MPTSLGSNIATVGAFDASLAQPNGENSGAYEIDLGADAAVALRKALSVIDQQSGGMTFAIAGNGAAIDNQNTQQGLFVLSGAVTIEDLTVEQAKAVGAAGVIGGGAGNDGAGALRGYVDGITPTLIYGWVQTIDHPEAPVYLDICANGSVIGRVLADRYRGDLAKAGLGSGRHGFAFRPPAGMTLRPEAVEVRRSLDGARLKAPSLANQQTGA